MTHRGILLWITVILAFCLAAAMVWAKLAFDLGTFLSTIIGLFVADTSHEHIGTMIDAHYSKNDNQ